MPTCAEQLIPHGDRNKGLSRAIRITPSGRAYLAANQRFMKELEREVREEFWRPRVMLWFRTSDGLVLEQPGDC
jgi:hypothetical protein